MAKGSWAAPVYVAAEAFVERCLRAEGSLTVPNSRSWTAGVAKDFHERFVVNEVTSGPDFVARLLAQLDDASDQTIVLAADLLYIYYLPIEDAAAKGPAVVQRVLALLPSSPLLSPDLASSLSSGFAKYGSARNQQWPAVRFLSEFAKSWTELDTAKREGLLTEPWEFKMFLAHLPHQSALQACALLHLVHPDHFEPMVAVDKKAAIAKAFAGVPGVAGENDVDRQLAAVRLALEPVLGTEFNFWDSAIEPVWSEAADHRPWTFAKFAKRFRDLPNFEEDEIDYKLELASRLAAARQAVLSSEADWLTRLKRAFASPNNITNWRHHDAFLKWCEAHPNEAKTALTALWSAVSAREAQVGPFLAAVLDQTSDSPGDRANIVSYLLGAWDPQDWVNYKATRSDRALRLCGLDPGETRDVAGRIARFSAFIDELRVRVVALAGRPTTRLEAQGMAWCVTGEDVPDKWTTEERAELMRFRGVSTNGNGGGNGSTSPLPAISDDFARSLFLPRPWLQEIVDLLTEKKQVVFYGPPGTGKTFLAQALTEYLAGGKDRSRVVQFHPSYAYEDFVEGYRPDTTTEAQLTYRLSGGALLDIAQQARSDPDGAPHFLVIDEINRGNTAKVFGELLYLLEYRKRSIRLQYSKEFTLPENLYFIGTMNTADRSIALVDTALRRRFYFVEFSPVSKELKGVLRGWLTENKLDSEAADLLDLLNARLEQVEGGHDFTIGPSYFMVDGGANLDHVWRYGIRPVLVERFYGRKTPLEIDAEFGFAALRPKVDEQEDAQSEAPPEEDSSGAV